MPKARNHVALNSTVVVVRFDDDLVKAIDKEAKRLGMSRSAFLRACAKHGLWCDTKKRPKGSKQPFSWTGE